MIYNKHHKNAPDDAIYIGRGSPYGNNWSHMENTKAEFKVASREDAVLTYDLWLSGQPKLIEKIKKELKGRDLLCFCKPLLCHGEVLERVSNDEGKWHRNWFSNMLPFDTALVYQGISYSSTENFYQSMKMPKDRLDLRKKIAAMTPQKSKTAIRDIDNYPWSEDWNKEKSLKVMEFALRHKFQKGTEWRRKLDLTNWELIEWNNWGDKFFGKCIKTGEGENNLGKLLMKIRDEKN
jgi:predicted NAD-dependent protein-ADP-ribosyltransferase YbiA (DUF1768 family)